MSETQTETPAAVAEPGGEGTNDERIGRLESAVNEILSLIKAKPEATAADDESASVASEVKRELEKLRAAEDRKREREAEKGKLAELEDKVRKVTEKPPREYRKVTKFFGWAGDDE